MVFFYVRVCAEIKWYTWIHHEIKFYNCAIIVENYFIYVMLFRFRSSYKKEAAAHSFPESCLSFGLTLAASILEYLVCDYFQLVQ